MRTKLIIAILLFVLGPTALLSFMAARALRNWELILEQRMELDAASTVQAVAARIEDRGRQALEQVVSAVSELRARGVMARDMARTAAGVEAASDWVATMYVFMNPWDFIHPPRPGPELAGGEATPRSAAVDERDLLLAALRRHIASATSLQAPFAFSVGERAFVFQLVRMEGLYAGYEIDRASFRRALETEVTRASGMFVICAEGPGVFIAPPGCREDEPEVAVVDSLSGERVLANGARSTPPFSNPVARARLAPPFDHVTVSAFLSDPTRARRMGALRARMYGWAVLLLALAILAGVGFTLHAAAVELRQARARSQYVIGVSHDLRTPLASMTMLTESLYTDRITDPDKRKQFLGTVLRECERLNQLIERVLFFVRYGQKALIFHREESDVGALVNEAVDAVVARSGGDVTRYPVPVTGGGVVSDQCSVVSDQCSVVSDQCSVTSDPCSVVDDSGGAESPNPRRSKSMPSYRTVGNEPRIRVTVQPDVPDVPLDRRAMLQVLLNLLDNAAKYGKRSGACPASSVDIDVHVDRCTTSRWGRKRRWIRIAVRDFGLGLEAGAAKRIFAPFYRSPRAAAANVSGVGVGLALCRHVVRAHGGRIEVKSEAGKGSTFYVLLPMEG